jgi:sulfite exporter TauE/SafE
VNTLLITAAVLGITGSLHCLGMCGPIAIALGRNNNSAFSLVSYNLGRISTYALLGGIFGFVGELLNFSLFQQYTSIIVGGVMILYVLMQYTKLRRFAAKTPEAWNAFSRKLIGKAIKSKKGMFVVGLANGLLPCGLVYVALAGSVAAGKWFEGALVMFVFGLATFPAMLAIPSLVQKLLPHQKAALNRAIPYVLVAFACLFILRGMNLGIPFISPQMTEVVNNGACCH